jgi:hypothetical protein
MNELPPPSPISVQRCKSCKAEILWATTMRGSRIPLDADHRPGFVMTGDKIDGAPQVEQKRVYTTHFATCPHAQQHRKAAK